MTPQVEPAPDGHRDPGLGHWLASEPPLYSQHQAGHSQGGEQTPRELLSGPSGVCPGLVRGVHRAWSGQCVTGVGTECFAQR